MNWDLLKKYGKPVAALSHTGATGMGTDWKKYEKIRLQFESVGRDLSKGPRILRGAGRSTTDRRTEA